MDRSKPVHDPLAAARHPAVLHVAHDDGCGVYLGHYSTRTWDDCTCVLSRKALERAAGLRSDR
jgi:hypothetical protein